ncbi:hypothetical protein HPB48_003212 [Haemaphysalis longicornis]|uniref:Transposable element n=1 Tax=Haemaphysalis longicornis TaxID=44386 RepID=A0A9J6H6B1_HAELO|nr:hypothetical protein HPB48_003212 [Haemaphysalis longicornis]
MGSCNKALWKILGISAGRYSRPSVSCRHPCAAGTDRQLHFLADAPHELKNIRGHLVRGQSFFLSSDTVAKYHLPSNQVSVHHIKALVKEDAERDLKLAPHLKPSHLEDNHFDKMNVSSAVAVLNHSVGAAMRVLVHLGLLLEEAWFVEQVFKWFTLMTSRYIGTAMSNFKESRHDEAVAFLEEFMVMFSSLSIKATSTDRDFFKPVQTGALISTTSALRIQHELLNKYNFLFVLLCRLTQDALENLFSCMGSKNPVPRALEFKLTLRLIMVSQFFRPSKKGSYAVDERTQLLEFVELKKAACEEDAEASNLLDGCLLEDEATAIDDVKMQSLVYLAGYITHSVTKKFKLCNTCKEYLQADKVDENDHLLALKSYRAQADPSPLVRPSRHVVKLLQHADNVFCTYESQILTTPLSALVNTSLQSHTLPGNFPQCHDLDKRLTSAFLMLRLRIALRKLSSKAKAAKAKCGSKSVGMRAALSQIR